MRKLLTVVIPFLFILNLTAQEMPDSMHLLNSKERFENNFDAVFFEQFLPLSGTFNTEKLKISQFLTYESIRNDPYLNTYQSHNIFLYKTPSFEYWRVNSPLSMGFLFNLDQISGWEKFNVFFDGSAQLVNLYELNEMGHAIMHEFNEGIFWELGAGTSYEFSPGKKLFIKSSIQFEGIKRTGFRHTGGVNMKF